jgi:hypothetical protein
MIAHFKMQVGSFAFDGAAQEIVNIDGHSKSSDARGFKSS